MSDKQRQTDEIEVLESIYDDDLIIFSKWPCSGCLRISPDPTNDEIDMYVVNVVNGQSVEKIIKLKYLAPIEMYFKCPIDYPSKSQPLFMLKCIWLPEGSLSAICRNFDEIWDSRRSEILYDWAYSLKDCCSFLKIEKLNFEVIVNESSAYPSELHLEQRTDLRLKVLRNKILESKNQSESHQKKTKYRRERNLRGNFKYETPKEKIETLTNAEYDPHIEKDDQSTHSSPLTFEFILSKLPTYGVRRKTLFSDCDSRVIPNYEENKPDQYGSHGVSLVVQKLIDFNDESIRKAFRHESHLCDICFDSKRGSESVRVQLCGHIFCRECISEYLRVNIANGNLRSLRCPHTDCGTLFTASQIRQNVDETTFMKFTEFSRKITVEDNPDLLYCPRDLCQSVARRCPKLGRELCYCSRCSFYFCIYCKKAYHGVQPCDLQNQERIQVISDYLNGDSNRRTELEKRYTKSQIDKWVDEYLTSKYIEEKSRPCPNCKAPIQKNDGCNKMLCFNCNIPFCWLCNKCLSTAKPYHHFSDVDSPCYQKLFVLPDAEEPEDLDVLEYEDFWEEVF